MAPRAGLIKVEKVLKQRASTDNFDIPNSILREPAVVDRKSKRARDVESVEGKRRANGCGQQAPQNPLAFGPASL